MIWSYILKIKINQKTIYEKDDSIHDDKECKKELTISPCNNIINVKYNSIKKLIDRKLL